MRLQLTINIPCTWYQIPPHGSHVSACNMFRYKKSLVDFGALMVSNYVKWSCLLVNLSLPLLTLFFGARTTTFPGEIAIPAGRSSIFPGETHWVFLTRPPPMWKHPPPRGSRGEVQVGSSPVVTWRWSVHLGRGWWVQNGGFRGWFYGMNIWDFQGMILWDDFT